MSMSGNNAHWISPRVISHQGFNCGYNRIYFEPDGTVLKCFRWRNEEMEVTDEIRERIEEVRNTAILGFKSNLKNEEVSNYSPYLVFSGYDYSLPELQRAYFSEHTTDDKGQSETILKEYPSEQKHIDYLLLITKNENKRDNNC